MKRKVIKIANEFCWSFIGNECFAGMIRFIIIGLFYYHMKKKGIIVAQSMIVWWILAILGLVVLLILYMVFSGKGQELIEFFENVRRFR
ncbi:MAG: hypothetical protein IIA87_00430 [Nanoarchaeota archaeon]|nr:hypothetical protein [Nanoarchaeota archaeon]